jgi:hypothetical protein
VSRVAALLLAALLLAAGPAWGLGFTAARSPDGVQLILASGEIAPGDAERLAEVLATPAPGGRLLLLHSEGGRLGPGLELAEAVRAAGLAVLVPPGAVCASTCFLVLAAAPVRLAARDARIGVHSAAAEDGRETINSLASTTVMAREARRFGVPEAILGRMVTTAPAQMTWLAPRELAAMGVRQVEAATAPKATPTPRAPTGAAASFAQGQQDRAAWEAWLAHLSPASRDGALYWAQLGRRRPGASCGGQGEQFLQGCLEASERAAPIQQRGAEDTEYRAGWQSQGGRSRYAW